MQTSAGGILLDIEGTTSSISFVFDVMFPFVRRELASYLHANWNTPGLNAACDLVAKDAGHESLDAWRGNAASGDEDLQLIQDEVTRLMDSDVKATGLKQLQGMIWESGFDSGELRAHVYDDVAPAIREWHDAGRDVRIYSSGSVAAQKLVFGHTISGDLLPLLRGHYDTNVGAKREADSYRTIATDFGRSPEDILFLSDVPAELDAASSAGCLTSLVIRPGNAEVPSDHGHRSITSFDQIDLS